MKLLADSRGVDPKFISRQGATAAQKLTVNSLARTVLPQAGPDDQVISSRRTDPGRILISVGPGIHPPHGSARARARNRPRKNIPTLGRHLQVFLSPRHRKPPIG